MKNKGLSILEVLVAILIMVISVGELALLYYGILGSVNLNSQNLRAWEIAKQEMEILRNSNFSALYAVSYNPEEPPLTNTFITGVVNTTGFYYVERMRDVNNIILNDLLKLQVIVCYRVGNRTIGEDQNLNGALDAGEDTNGDNKVSSPVTLRTLVMGQ